MTDGEPSVFFFHYYYTIFFAQKRQTGYYTNLPYIYFSMINYI